MTHGIDHFSEALSQRRCAGVEVHEDEIEPGLDPELREHAGGGIEVLHVLELRRLEEASVERIRPAVIAALQDRPLPLPFRHRPSAMAADVGHRAQHAVRPADHEQRLVRDRRGEELPRLPHLVTPSRELPRLREDRPLLARKHRRIDVVARRNRRRMLEPRIELPGHRERRISPVHCAQCTARHGRNPEPKQTTGTPRSRHQHSQSPERRTRALCTVHCAPCTRHPRVRTRKKIGKLATNSPSAHRELCGSLAIAPPRNTRDARSAMPVVNGWPNARNGRGASGSRRRNANTAANDSV